MLFDQFGINIYLNSYFKREAINYAWEFLTQVLKIPVEKLSVTVFEEDKEAEKIWLDEIKVDDVYNPDRDHEHAEETAEHQCGH